VLQWGAENKVDFAPEKCELMHFSRKKDEVFPDAVINDELTMHPITDAPPVKTKSGVTKPGTPALRWLGVWFDSKLKFKRHVRERFQKATRLANHLRGLAKTIHGPPAHSLRLAVKTCVLPTALYGSEAWYAGRMKPNNNRARAAANDGKPVSAKLGWHIQELQKVINVAARAVLPVWRTTPVAVLHKEAGLPPATVVLEEAKLRFAHRLQVLDPLHPLVSRLSPGNQTRGRHAGEPKRKVTKLHVLNDILPPIKRPVLTIPRCPPGSRIDPTKGKTKEEAKEAFLGWLDELSTDDLVIYSDGSQLPPATRGGIPRKGYGYAIYQKETLLCTGYGRLHDTSVVFDAEALGALKGLRRALTLPEYTGLQRITVCLDNTAAIWCLRGNPSLSGQHVFTAFHEIADAELVHVKWSPGHVDIEGNEEADKQAKKGAQSMEVDPDSGPTAAGIRSIGRKLYKLAALDAWASAQTTLSSHYRKHCGDFTTSTKCPEPLTLRRGTLGRWLALRTTHGDFCWYHERFQHEDYNPDCTCGRVKTPSHVVHCTKVRKTFKLWPWPSSYKNRPQQDQQSTRERYFSLLLADSSLFAKFLEVTDFYRSICPR
jgi:ribonuclease HI